MSWNTTFAIPVASRTAAITSSIAGAAAVFAIFALGTPDSAPTTLSPDVRATNLEDACNEPPRPDLWPIKRQLLAGRPSTEFILDHRIPRKLGGSDEPSNLWLETTEDASAKDEVERQYITPVCYRHQVSVPDAQAYFRSWRD